MAHRARVTVEECRKAIETFLAPDPDDTSKVEGGRRIREVEGGYLIVNHEAYRYSSEAKREFWRSMKAEAKSKKAAKKEGKVNQHGGVASAAEREHVRAYEAGEVDGDGTPVSPIARALRSPTV